MPTPEPKRSWEDRVKQAAEHAQEELRRVVQYIDSDVVPEVRRNGSAALRAAAEHMQKLAQHLDDAMPSRNEGPSGPQ